MQMICDVLITRNVTIFIIFFLLAYNQVDTNHDNSRCIHVCLHLFFVLLFQHRILWYFWLLKCTQTLLRDCFCRINILSIPLCPVSFLNGRNLGSSEHFCNVKRQTKLSPYWGLHKLLLFSLEYIRIYTLCFLIVLREYGKGGGGLRT